MSESTGTRSSAIRAPFEASVSRPANLFDVLRLLAASMVIVGHSWSLLGLDGVPRLAGITVHHFGVYIFFAISGFLLNTSWQRSPRPAAYMVRRCLRIFPALFVVVVLTVFVVGPLFASNVAAYWGSSQTWQYLWNLTLVAQYELPGVFLGNDQQAVNGSLWSLGPEFCCYLMVLLLGLLGQRVSAFLRAGLGFALLVATIAIPIERPLRITAIAVVFFIAGSLLSQVRRPASLPWWPVLPGVGALFFVAGDLGLILACVVVPYAVVALGSQSNPAAGFFRRMGDPSYGMYLWGFVIQQALIQWVGELPLAVNIFVVWLVALAFGYLSWHLVERRAIGWGVKLSASLKKRDKAYRID